MILVSGTLLGRYRLHNSIGSSSTGDVYLAEEVQNGRQVVLKVLRIELPLDVPDESIQLFRREVAKIADLQHVHILPLLDFGNVVFDNTMLFYTVMQQYKGATLDTWLQQRGSSDYFSPADVVTLLQPIADALDYAHSQQVVHQSIRPTNLLVRSRNSSALPDLLLTDFYIASLHPTIPDPSCYVAPEQWAGMPVAATDQYSLAAIAYLLLTGNTPFQGTPEQIKQQQLNAIPRPVNESSAQLPTDIDTVLLMGLAKEPQRRFPSVGAFISALQQATQQRTTPESVTLPAQPILTSVQKPSASRPLEQTVPPQPISSHTDNTQQTPTPTQSQPLTPPLAVPQQVPSPSTTLAAPAKNVATSPFRRDSALMNILSFLLLATIIMASSLGIFIKQQHDQPGIDATATAAIKSQNSDISSYNIPGQKQGDLLIYDPLSNKNTSWTSGDSLGTCDIFSLSKALIVTTTPSSSTPTPSSSHSVGTSPTEESFHSCSTTDYGLSSNNPPFPNNMIIEVQVHFDNKDSIGGIIFSQIQRDNSEKFFIFSISLAGQYNFCLLDTSNQTCSAPNTGYFNPAFMRISEDFNRIAIRISGNVYYPYLNDQPLSEKGAQLEQNSVSQVTPPNNVGVVAGVVPSVENNDTSEHVRLLYRNLKIWQA